MQITGPQCGLEPFLPPFQGLGYSIEAGRESLPIDLHDETEALSDRVIAVVIVPDVPVYPGIQPQLGTRIVLAAF
ncbi:hypothetical protein DSECCO2_548360 [anaerobic digester metagenome]